MGELWIREHLPPRYRRLLPEKSVLIDGAFTREYAPCPPHWNERVSFSDVDAVMEINAHQLWWEFKLMEPGMGLPPNDAQDTLFTRATKYNNITVLQVGCSQYEPDPIVYIYRIINNGELQLAHRPSSIDDYWNVVFDWRSWAEEQPFPEPVHTLWVPIGTTSAQPPSSRVRTSLCDGV